MRVLHRGGVLSAQPGEHLSRWQHSTSRADALSILASEQPMGDRSRGNSIHRREQRRHKGGPSGAFGSGGGFSRSFAAPEEQLTAIKAYFSHAPQLPPNGSFPVDGRGTPDVAALGERYQVFADGRLMSVGGTSSSAPVFAGLVSLLNEARLQAGRSAMGFLNPWLYANEHAFTDIVEGDNFIGRGDRLAFGFNCTVGWDPVTGLGTPVFNRMLDAAMTMTSAATVV